VVVLFSFDIVTNVLISPCIFLLIAYIIWHLLNTYFSQNLNTSFYNCVSNCQERGWSKQRHLWFFLNSDISKWRIFNISKQRPLPVFNNTLKWL
jgi:hypothetical protein